MKLARKISFAIRTNTRARWAAFVCIFAVGLLLGFIVEWQRDIRREANVVYDFKKIHPLDNHYSFINPLLGFDRQEDYGEYAALKKKIQNFIVTPDVLKNATGISVYFRSVETGEWVGINEGEQYDPASLLKVPVMMFYLKLAESDPSILSRTYAYTAKDIALLKSAGGDVATQLAPNTPYTVDQLLPEMIIRSDNIAKYLLILNSPKDDLWNIYGSLGVQLDKDGPYKSIISTRTYSLFFRTLYNSTFLNEDMSEKALKMLSQTEFKNGIVAGVPGDIKIAHKFGRYTNIQNGAVISVEAHDCGIIYYSHSPYLLCVMTRGNDTNQLEQIISQVSRLTYEFMDENKSR